MKCSSQRINSVNRLRYGHDHVSQLIESLYLIETYSKPLHCALTLINLTSETKKLYTKLICRI
jgi:hypothetical protein